MWNRIRFIRFLQVSQIFQRRKSDTNKQDFENKLNLTCHAQSTPKTTGFLNKVFSTSGPNLVALAWTVDELSREQAQNGVNFDFEVKFDLEGQGQSPPKTIGILTKVFYTYGPNLVILAWTGDELSRGQTWWRTDGLTDGRTDAGNDNTRRPILASGKNCCEIGLLRNTSLEWFIVKYHNAICVRAIVQSISNISGTQPQNLYVSRVVFQLSLPNPLKPGVKSRMEM